MSHDVTFYEHYRDTQPELDCWKVTDNYCYPHFHSSMELVFVHEGEMEITLNGKNFMLKKNQVLIVPSYTVHRFFTHTNSLVSVLALPLDYLSSLRKLMSKKTFASYILSDCADVKEIEFYIDKLNHVRENPVEPYRVRGYAYAIVGILIENIGLVDRSELTDPYQLQNILGYLDDNFMQSLTLDEIASHFGYSKSRFSHIFNENVGCSISEYLGFLRSLRAAKLLSQEDATITDVAMDAGFGSTRSFYRSFQQSFGITPNEYRQLDKSERSRITSRHPVSA